MARTADCDLHIPLTRDQHSRLRRLSRKQAKSMVQIARAAIVERLNFYDEEEEIERAEGKKKQEESIGGLGIDFQARKEKREERAALIQPIVPETTRKPDASEIDRFESYIVATSNENERRERLLHAEEMVRTLYPEHGEALVRTLRDRVSNSPAVVAQSALTSLVDFLRRDR